MTDLFGADLPAGERIVYDSYYTPAPIARAIVEWLRIPPRWAVWEPHAGSGSFVDALRAVGHVGDIIATDVNPESRCCSVGIPGARCWRADALEVAHRLRDPSWPTWDKHAPSVADDIRARAAMFPQHPIILGNPPYVNGTEHVEALIATGRPVALLLRSTFLGSDERSDLLRRHPPAHVWRFVDRIQFGGTAGGDSVQHELVIWLPGHVGEARFALVRPGWPPPTPPAWSRL